MTERPVGPYDWDEAVGSVEGPQLIVAGPGTGKTEFLVRRAVRLVQAGHAEPHQLLLLTFSRRAAADLKRRVLDELNRSTVDVSASTFHSFCYRLLESVGPEKLGRRKLPTILTGPEQVALVGELLRADRPSRWPVLFRPLLGTQTFSQEVAEFILRARDRLLDGPALEELAGARDEWRALPGFIESYDTELSLRHRIDYATLQAVAVEALTSPEIRRQVASQSRYVLVDEYQDTAYSQARLLQLLVADHGNVTAAADPYQSIYGFRGAEPSNVAEFADAFSFPDAPAPLRLVLETSFRVPETVLVAAERLIEGHPLGGAAPVLRSTTQKGRVDVAIFDQHTHEADWIAGEIRRLHLAEGLPYSDVAVLVRTKRRLLPELSRALDRRGVPHDQPEERLVDHPAAQALLACVAAADLEQQAQASGKGPAAEAMRIEADRAVQRVLLGPVFAVPLALQRELTRERARSGTSWADLIRSNLDAGEGLAELLASDEWVRSRPADQGFWFWWTRIPQLERFVSQPGQAEFRAAWSSLSQSLGRIADRDPSTTLGDYLLLASQDDFEATPLLSYRPAEGERVAMTTLHQAKGLEFDVVFIADAVEGVFPDLRRHRSLLHPDLLGGSVTPNAAEAVTQRLAEEMRLAYTAMTRARRRVVWTATQAGIDEGQHRPSRFLPLVAGVGGVDDLGSPAARTESPVTASEAEALLRSTLADPAEPHGRRLAAAHVLASQPHPDLRAAKTFAMVREPGPDRGLVPEDVRLSPTQAETFEECPRRYALVRRLGIGDTDSVYARFGLLIHDVLHQAEAQAMSRDEPHARLEDAIEVLDTEMPSYDFGGRPSAKAWRSRAVDLLTRLYSNWPRPDAQPVSLEHRLELELEGTPWIGYADRIEKTSTGELRVVDYKTSKSAVPNAEAAESLQLGYYALAAAADRDIREDGSVLQAEFWYPLAGTSKDSKTAIRTLSTGRLDQVRNRLVAAAEGIRAEEWPPRLNQGCRRCPVRTVCPEWPEGREAFSR